MTFDITLPDTNAHNLKDLVVAAYPTDARAKYCLEFSELELLADSANANLIAVGDSDVTDAIYAYALAAGDRRYYRRERGRQRIYLQQFYVKADGGTPKLRIEGII